MFLAIIIIIIIMVRQIKTPSEKAVKLVTSVLIEVFYGVSQH